MRIRSALIAVLIASVLPAWSGSFASKYPNELSGYEHYSTARWASLRPLVTKKFEALALLGQPEGASHDGGPAWRFVVLYLGEGGTCSDQALPTSLVDTVIRIEVIPKARVSLKQIAFPSSFSEYELFSAHDPVGAWAVYKDDYGLEYHIYREASEDGTIREGDLKTIVYGPSKRAYETLTGCEWHD